MRSITRGLRTAKGAVIRLGRFLLVLVLASLLAAVAAAWLLPVDGARFRAAIEAAASQRLGASVHIDGPIVLHLLPTPTLDAAALRLAIPGGGGEADSLRLQVALGPLLGGRLAPRDLVLRGPRIRLPWPPPLPERVQTPAFSARVQDGALTLGALTLAAIDAAVTTDPQTGAATLIGTLRLAGRPWRASASLSHRGGDGAAGLRMTLDSGQAGKNGFAARLSGQLAADGVLSGRVTARGDDLSQLAPAPVVAFAAEGRVSVAAGMIAVNDISADVAGTPAHGNVTLQLSRPRLDLTMAVARLDLDQWLAPFRHNNGESLLRGLPLEVAVSADAATLSGATLRTVRATLDNDGSNTTTLREATAVLPGETPLRLFSGTIARDAAGQLLFKGDGHLATADFGQVGGWLTQAGVLPPGAFPAAAPRTLDIAATIALDASRLSLERIRGQADGGGIAGRMTVRRNEDGWPVIAAALQLDRLDLDRWMPRAWPNGRAPPIDFDLQVASAAATLRGVTLGQLRADIGASHGKVTLRHLDAVTQGGTLAASGAMSRSGSLSDARLALELPHAGTLDGLLPWPLPAGLRDMPAALRVAASGRPEALSTQLDSTLGALTVTASQRLDLSGGSLANAGWHGPIRLQAPSARTWLDAAGLGDLPWLGDGSLAVTADLAAGSAQVALDSLRANLGELRGGGTLRLDLARGEPALSGSITADQLRLPGLPRRDDPLPFGGLNGWRAALHIEAASVTQPDTPALSQVSGDLALAAGSLRLSGLRAQVAGGALTGMAELATTAQPPHLTLQLVVKGATLDGPLFGLPVDLVAGSLDGAAALEASGHSVAALLATSRGSLQIEVRDGVLQGIAAAELPPQLPDTAVDAALAGGRTTGLRGSVALQAGNGALTVANAGLTAPGVALGLSGSVEFAAATANLLWSVRPDLPNSPELDLRLAGKLPHLERSPELAKLARWRVSQLPH